MHSTQWFSPGLPIASHSALQLFGVILLFVVLFDRVSLYSALATALTTFSVFYCSIFGFFLFLLFAPHNSLSFFSPIVSLFSFLLHHEHCMCNAFDHLTGLWIYYTHLRCHQRHRAAVIHIQFNFLNENSRTVCVRACVCVRRRRQR